MKPLLLNKMLVVTILVFVLLPVLAHCDSCMPTMDMIDASGKIPSGISSGNIIDFGSFDQCLSLNSTQYCLVKIKLPLNISENKLHENEVQERNRAQARVILNNLNPNDQTPGLILGWCLPDTCPIHNVTYFLSEILKESEISFSPVSDGLMCQTKDVLEWNLNTEEWIVVGFLAFFLLITVLSTIYDISLHYQKKEPAHLLLIAFSVKMNGQKLLAVSNNPDQLPCVHGVRFMSMMWVVLGHRYFVTSIEPMINLKDMGTWMDNIGNMYVRNADLSVDSFFVLSGLLVSYVFLLAKNKGVKFNIILYYVHRYLRLTPVLGVLILVHATIIKYFGSGPTWPLFIISWSDGCSENWWPALLYIQNYYNPDVICLGESWYLSVDFQLFLLSPLLLIPLARWPKITMIISAFLVIGSMAIGFVVSWHYDLPPLSLGVENNGDYMDKYYMVTHTRFGPWVMGLMLGYYIFKLKKNRNRRHSKMHPVEVTYGWIFSLAVMLVTLFAPHKLIAEPDRLSVAFFNGMHRHAWALGLCWVIFACTQGYGGFINSILSWSVFQVLSRFTYTIYLTHLTIQIMMTSALRTNTHFSDYTVIHAFWGDLFVSLAIAAYFTLSFESPMLTIEKVLFKRGSNKNKPVLPTHHKNTQSRTPGQTNEGFVKD